MTTDNIDKKIRYENKKAIKDEIKDLVARKPVQLELPLDNPNDNVIPFPYKPGSPILEWWKASKDKVTQVASIDDLAPFLSQYYSQKQLLEMSETEIEKALQDLLDKGVL